MDHPHQQQKYSHFKKKQNTTPFFSSVTYMQYHKEIFSLNKATVYYILKTFTDAWRLYKNRGNTVKTDENYDCVRNAEFECPVTSTTKQLTKTVISSSSINNVAAQRLLVIKTVPQRTWVPTLTITKILIIICGNNKLCYYNSYNWVS